MEDLEPFNCYICSRPYDYLLHKPVKGICGHTICENCRRGIVIQSNSKCPFCKMDLSFLDNVGNWQLVDELPEIKECRSNLAQEIRDIRRTHLTDDRRILSFKNQLKLQREKQLQRIQTMKAEVEDLQNKIKTLKENNHEFVCSRCQVPMNQSAARICLQCSLTKKLFSRIRNNYIVKNEEKVWKEALCGGCILNSVHRFHSSARVVNLIISNRFDARTSNYVAKLKQYTGNDIEEVNKKYTVLKNRCRTCDTIEKGSLLIEETVSYLEEKLGPLEEKITETIEIL